MLESEIITLGGVEMFKTMVAEPIVEWEHFLEIGCIGNAF
jgi:hypothetical protein